MGWGESMFYFYVCSHRRDIRPTQKVCVVLAAAVAAAAATLFGEMLFLCGVEG